METKLLCEKDILAAKSVWKSCFNDTDAFIDWYFKNYVHMNQALGLFEEGELISNLHMIPRLIDLIGQKMECPFIVGAATLPKARKQGHMAELLKKSYEVMRSWGAAVCALYPFDYDFYKRYGFGVYTGCIRYSEPARVFRNFGSKPLTPLEPDAFWEIYNDFISRFTGFTLRDLRVCALKLEEAALDGAYSVTTGDAYAVYSIKENHMTVHELAYKSGGLRPMLGAISTLADRIDFALPVAADLEEHRGVLEPFGMLRVLEIQKVFKKLPAQGTGCIVNVIDKECPWNNGAFDFNIQGGILNIEKTDKAADIVCTPDVLAQLLTGYQGPKGELHDLFKHIKIVSKPPYLFEMY